MRTIPSKSVYYDSVSDNYDFSRRAGPKSSRALIGMLNPIHNVKVSFSDIDVHPCPFDGLSTESPQAYLDKRYRDGLSMFSYLRPRDIEQGCDKIRQDLVSGEAIKVVETLRETIERISGQVTFIRSVKS